MQQRKKKKHSVLLIFFVAAVLVVAFVLTSGLFFKVTAIRVEGGLVTGEKEVAEMSGISLGDNIFFINKVSAARNIKAQLPYVQEVRISRSLPGTVLIRVTEAAPAGMIEDRGAYWLFDTQGVLLESVPVLTPPKLPVVRGLTLVSPLPGGELDVPEEDRVKVAPLLELLRTLLAEGLWEDVSSADVSRLANLRFTYKEIAVELGAPDLLERKLRTMSLALEQIGGAGTLYLAPVAEGQPSRFIPEQTPAEPISP